MIPRSIRLRFWLGVTGLLVVVGKLDVGGEESGMRHPYMLVTGSPVAGLRSVDAVRRDVKEGRSARLWQELRAKVDKEMKLPLVVAGTKHNRSYRFVATACNRIADSALVALITNERKYALSSLAQIEVLFDPVKWPEWSDQAHLDAGLKSDLRHGQFARAIGFAFDWMYQLLTPAERKRIVTGLDRCAIKPFKASVAAKEKWIFRQSNWKTSVVGGFAILGRALGDDHPEAGWLVEFADPLMDKYMEIFGPDGEFNENPGYASSVRFVVDHYLARYYTSGGKDKPVQLEQLRAFSQWILYCISPPRRMLAFGDAQTSASPNLAYFCALASVLRDPVIQWTYLRYVDFSSEDARPRAQELLSYDPTVRPTSPAGRLPATRNFPAQSGIVASRSGWDPEVPVSAVWAKARTEDVHRHADWGQVCIDGLGERLIVDLGSPPVYPKTGKRHYYNYQQSGHNVLAIGDDEYDVDWRVRRQGKTIRSSFDDRLGAAWTFDLSDVYANGRKVHRHILHLFPRIVAVLDEATLPHAERIRLRWHTSKPAQPDSEGRFVTGQRGVQLAGQTISLSGAVNISSGRHEYLPPYDKGRLGNPYRQRHEPFVQVDTRTDRLRLLTLFCVVGRGEDPQRWQKAGNAWRIECPEGTVIVQLNGNSLIVRRGEDQIAWSMGSL